VLWGLRGLAAVGAAAAAAAGAGVFFFGGAMAKIEAIFFDPVGVSNARIRREAAREAFVVGFGFGVKPWICIALGAGVGVAVRGLLSSCDTDVKELNTEGFFLAAKMKALDFPVPGFWPGGPDPDF